MGKESKRQVRKVLREVMNDPRTSPHDKLMASARYERLKYKPRGRHVSKAKEASPAEQSTEPQIIKQEVMGLPIQHPAMCPKCGRPTDSDLGCIPDYGFMGDKAFDWNRAMYEIALAKSDPLALEYRAEHGSEPQRAAQGAE